MPNARSRAWDYFNSNWKIISWNIWPDEAVMVFNQPALLSKREILWSFP